ncbi:hypothetical protein [Erythrobacter sp. JK5]|uniref:hypothetical protein n=1 Tax=Erythrobacter sp. JK5 TaxID=2829500 RepID=UPI001BABD05A|nr:hypothetical protein [Erythrobacter sp. JK5]QUL37851.1 hypothetical protein KDC96_16250 [Erythrobacter sp. JK5]
MDHNPVRILIVYNADSGVLNALKDALHKQFSPATYPCSLCAVTYGAVTMRREWRRFLQGLALETVFHHRDDFAACYPGYRVALPAILVAGAAGYPRVLVPAEAIDRMFAVEELIHCVEAALVAESLLPDPELAGLA